MSTTVFTEPGSRQLFNIATTDRETLGFCAMLNYKNVPLQESTSYEATGDKLVA